MTDQPGSAAPRPPASIDADLRARLANVRTIDLTTTGRRSGEAARIEIWWFHVNGRFVITGTPGPRDWFANVLADPEVMVHVRGTDYPARATPITDPVIRAEVFDHPDTHWYTTQSQRQRLIDTAPMIEITLLPATAG